MKRSGTCYVYVLYLYDNEVRDLLEEGDDARAFAVILGARPGEADAVHHGLELRLEAGKVRLALDFLKVLLER